MVQDAKFSLNSDAILHLLSSHTSQRPEQKFAFRLDTGSLHSFFTETDWNILNPSNITCIRDFNAVVPMQAFRSHFALFFLKLGQFELLLTEIGQIKGKVNMLGRSVLAAWECYLEIKAK